MDRSAALDFPDREAWRAWLQANHDEASEAWVLHHKKSSRSVGLRYDEAVEEALCFGWIDSKAISVDSDVYAQRYTPRRPTSVWSRRNVERVERMIAQGKMTPAGLALVEEAKRRGTWQQAY